MPGKVVAVGSCQWSELETGNMKAYIESVLDEGGEYREIPA